MALAPVAEQHGHRLFGHAGKREQHRTIRDIHVDLAAAEERELWMYMREQRRRHTAHVQQLRERLKRAVARQVRGTCGEIRIALRAAGPVPGVRIAPVGDRLSQPVGLAGIDAERHEEPPQLLLTGAVQIQRRAGVARAHQHARRAEHQCIRQDRVHGAPWVQRGAERRVESHRQALP